MKQKSRIGKIATDMSWLQLTWLAWFVSIVLIIYIGMQIIGGEIVINSLDLSEQSFLTFIYRPAKIALLVIGIISVSGFLTFYVKQGITRKEYFFGAAISSFIIIFFLMTVAAIITFIEQILNRSPESISFLGPDASIVLAVIVYSLNILVYFMSGWLIGAGFYRHGGLGMIFILLALVFISLSDILWEFELNNPINAIFDLSTQWKFPMSISFNGTLILIGISLWLVRITTKNIRIKMK